ncbi:MAG: hypothetical protein M3450_17495, partial [Actinomycetota bacterium]|nr:hypothetical protein [Actinomycetota bacterium]
VQLFDEVPLALAVMGTVVALAAMTLVLTTEHRRGAAFTAIALLGGLGLDVAMRTAFLTWEPAWQPGPVPLVFGMFMSAALGAAALAAVRAGRSPAEGRPAAITSLGGGVAVGATLAVEFLFLASPSFVASSAGVTLPWAALVVAAGIAIAIAAFALTSRSRPTVVVGAAAGLATLGFLLPHSVGWPVVLAVAAGQGAAGTVLAGAVRPRTRSRLGAELGVALGWLAFALTVLLYQLHFDQPLPFDNAWVVAGAGALTVLAVVGRPGQVTGRPAVGATASACAVVVVAGLIAGGLAADLSRGATATAPGRNLRVVEWNVRQAVTENGGQLDPARIESVLTDNGTPDIVVLLEVARGWPLSGDLDLASWLSRHLDMPFVWGPAADQQFGTVVFSRLPIISTQVRKLPVAGRAQGRSLVQAVLDLGDGQRLTVLATHLQHRNDESSMAARMHEIDVIIGQWARAPRTILVGDFNPRQGDPPRYPLRRPGEFPEIRAILESGFRTDQDLTDCSQPTSARNCSDFVFVTADIDQQVRVLQDVTDFDHRPVMSTIHVR